MTDKQDPAVEIEVPALEAPAPIAAWLRQHLGAGSNLSLDSRTIAAGDAFFACPGGQADGREFIARAVLSGATAVLWEREKFTWPHGGAVAHRPVSGLRQLAGPIAAEFYGQPSTKLDLIAVTGTNGKTSCTQWIAQGLEASGNKSAVIGTLGSGQIDALDPFGLTTPDAVSLQRMLARFVAAGVQTVAIEASSIGLAQGRLAGARVVAAVFTNLSHDHLDYHHSMADYAAAKSLLFRFPELKVAVVNVDDPAAPQMIAALDAEAMTRGTPRPRRIGFGFAGPAQTSVPVDSILIAEQWRQLSGAVAIRIGGDFGTAEVELELLGRFSVANVLAVAATWVGLGMPFDQAMTRLRALRPVPGRMQAIDVPGQPLIVVDYAHTPDALLNVLQALRPVTGARNGRLWCVFGAGGNRDATKRPLMGQIVERLADHLVVTSDNPRAESPLRVVADIRAGLTREPRLTELDRARAIEAAIAGAAAADVVLIAGKGHEDYQEIAGRKLPFSDVDEARRALAARAEATHA